MALKFVDHIKPFHMNLLLPHLLYIMHHTAENLQVALSLLTSCNNLLQQADSLQQLVEDKSVASCQQTCFKLIVQTCYQQAC